MLLVSMERTFVNVDKNMESAKILTLLLVSATLSEVGGKNLIIECEEDHECGEKKFCYQTGLCAPCTNCSTYFRMPHEWKYCSKSPNECGPCLPGYAADPLTDGRERELCTQVQQSEGSRSIPGDQWSNWLSGIMVIGIPLAVLCVILLICWKTGACRINRGEVLKTERPLSGPVNMRPPPYSSCGGSPLLTRHTGESEYYCGSVWHTDHKMSGSSYHDKEPVKTSVVEKTIDGVQQATPFEYQPDELQKINPQSRTRSSCRPNDACRPNDGTDHHDEDDDNEDGLSVTFDNGVNEVDPCNSGLSNNTEHMEVDLNQSEEAAAPKQGDIMVEAACRKCALNRKTGSNEHMFDTHGSLCNIALRSDHSTYSLCSVSDIEGSCQVPVQCSCKKKILKTFLPSKYDSGFISKSSVKFEELHDDTSRENTQTRDKPPSTEGGSININLPVNINILNHVNIC
ncbi:uncharacterized protein LOC126188981 isoform X1 [Schistocerca cancellata]|uniref:uncharacterized protein LOC126188981 isoform X1 n=2 Tax=Schistocerca cancellata TaxID=274614 RepID=UPI002119A6F8|nr:uncharacterized protein LOC126188981 isoform X1 [Schistocerca cancellata]